jgi:hypothetical protein
MTKTQITPTELISLMDWIATFESPPRVINIISNDSNGISRSVRAEVETAEGEGRYKDITDHESF